jgi:hypothetical protein
VCYDILLIYDFLFSPMIPRMLPKNNMLQHNNNHYIKAQCIDVIQVTLLMVLPPKMAMDSRE